MPRSRLLLAPLLAPFVALALTAACAHSPQATPPTSAPAPAAPSPSVTPPPAPAPTPAASIAGTYDFTANYQGQPIDGTIVITAGDDGAYGGTISTEALGTSRIASVAVDGQTIAVTGEDSGSGASTLTLRMNGMDFTGSWEYGGMGGQLRGRKRE